MNVSCQVQIPEDYLYHFEPLKLATFQRISLFRSLLWLALPNTFFRNAALSILMLYCL